ncbi:hypothetical protein C5167_021821 [Papaver somniferum]|uniref:Uncharacterized protein n=1 Tax=Papaver somniferum TaxID=3469 RepID=A0A4Y7JJ32_PAPSO|nr:hypothetical protein C5167_021821 [Papaver somniferum]
MAIEEFRVRTGQSFKPISRFRPGSSGGVAGDNASAIAVRIQKRSTRRWCADIGVLSSIEFKAENVNSWWYGYKLQRRERAATGRNFETGGAVVFETAGNGLCESAGRNGMMGVELQFTS